MVKQKKTVFLLDFRIGMKTCFIFQLIIMMLAVKLLLYFSE